MGNLLTASEIQSYLLDERAKDEWLSFFEKHEFEKLPKGKHLGVVPYNHRSLGPVSLDLTIGDEVYSLRRAEKFKLTREKPAFFIDPGETILILTREFLALSPYLAAITLARAKLMNEGIALSSAKIDPTWYGCLQIPITNNSRTPLKLVREERFCTALFFFLGDPTDKSQFLTKENTLHLGQMTHEYNIQHASGWIPVDPEIVCDGDMKKLVAAFGPPFDVIHGMFVWSKKQILDQLNKDWSTTVLHNLRKTIMAEEFEQIKQHRQLEISILKEQIGILKEQLELIKKDKKAQYANSLTILVGIVAWVATVMGFLLTIFLKFT